MRVTAQKPILVQLLRAPMLPGHRSNKTCIACSTAVKWQSCFYDIVDIGSTSNGYPGSAVSKEIKEQAGNDMTVSHNLVRNQVNQNKPVVINIENENHIRVSELLTK
jgi:hypothetical protein